MANLKTYFFLKLKEGKDNIRGFELELLNIYSVFQFR